MGNVSENPLQEFLELTKRKREIKAELDMVESDLKTLNQRVIEYLDGQGVDSVRVGGRTVYVNRMIYASFAGVDPAVYIPALEAAGMGALVQPKVDGQRLSAAVREFDNGQDRLSPEEIQARLPESLRGLVKISEVFTPRVKQA